MDYNTRFFKQYGAEQEQNCLIVLAPDHSVIFVGYGTDDLGGYRWRKDYNHTPTVAEIRADVESLINERVAKTIRECMTYEGDPVWLSEENQLNFRSAPTTPVRFKLGEDSNGHPVYRTFTSKTELNNFNKAVADYIAACLNDGWNEKGSIDYSVFEEAAQ